MAEMITSADEFQVGHEYVIVHTKKTSQFDRPGADGTIRVNRTYRVMESNVGHVLVDSFERKRPQFREKVQMYLVDGRQVVFRRINWDQIVSVEPLQRTLLSDMMMRNV